MKPHIKPYEALGVVIDPGIFPDDISVKVMKAGNGETKITTITGDEAKQIYSLVWSVIQGKEFKDEP